MSDFILKAICHGQDCNGNIVYGFYTQESKPRLLFVKKSKRDKYSHDKKYIVREYSGIGTPPDKNIS